MLRRRAAPVRPDHLVLPPARGQTRPVADIHNRDPALRSRPIVGLPLLQDFAPTGDDSWGGGTIYDPESGKTYKSKMRLKEADRLEVSRLLPVLLPEPDLDPSTRGGGKPMKRAPAGD